MVDLSPYPDYEDSYRDANIAMTNWLATQSLDVWVWAAPNLNWDRAVPTLHWLIDQPRCDLVVAAMVFWLGCDGLLDEDMTPEEAERSPETRLCMAIVRRLSANGYSADYALPDRRRDLIPKPNELEELQAAGIPCMPGVAFPAMMLGPFGKQTATLPAEADPGLNPAVWDLFNALGTIFGERPTAPAG